LTLLEKKFDHGVTQTLGVTSQVRELGAEGIEKFIRVLRREEDRRSRRVVGTSSRRVTVDDVAWDGQVDGEVD